MEDPEDCELWQCGSSKPIWETAADNCEVYFIWIEVLRNTFDFLYGNKKLTHTTDTLKPLKFMWTTVGDDYVWAVYG